MLLLQVAVTTTTNCGFELLPLSRIFTRFCFLRFVPVRQVEGRASDDYVIVVVKLFLDKQDKDLYKIGRAKMQQHWTKCIQLKGDCRKKKNPLKAN